MSATATIMVVDDTPLNIRLLSRILQVEGYRVRAFSNGPEALAAAQAEPPALVLLDITMPDMDGYEVCATLKANPLTADIPVLFISALSQPTDKVRAFSVGGVDYVTKPFDRSEVMARVATHLELRRLREEQVAESWLATILALSKLAESRDDDTGKHIERVQTYCGTLAAKLAAGGQLNGPEGAGFVETLVQASPLHDIGKVGLPDAVLLKPARLNDEEFAVMQRHTVLGAQTLQAVTATYPHNTYLNMGIEVARWHHERWDGSGYPDGLLAGEIPIAARIVAVADVYDALRSARCYKPAFSHERTRDLIRSAGGKHFDPLLIAVFDDLEDEFRRIHAELSA